MAKKKKKDSLLESDEVLDSNIPEGEIFENNEINQNVISEKRVGPNAKLSKLDKGIPNGKITFDIFFAYCLRKWSSKVKPEHYRQMKNYLTYKNCAIIDTKDGFCKSFKNYGLIID